MLTPVKDDKLTIDPRADTQYFSNQSSRIIYYVYTYMFKDIKKFLFKTIIVKRHGLALIIQ